MSFFDDMIAASSIDEARAIIVGYAQAALLPVTSWIVGSVGQQMLEVATSLTYAAEQARGRIVRGFASLDTSTDPGDVDLYNPSNVDLEPAPGFLSFFGQNTFGTVRVEETFASGYVTFTNAGVTARTFKPYALVFTWTANTPPSPAPTYRNSADNTIYTNPDGSVTVAAGDELTIPVVAEERGTGSNTPAASLSLTTTLIGCTATNGSAVLAVDREAADTYRARCRQAPARVSLAGPDAAYQYLAVTNLDGTPLVNESENPVNINRVWVSQDSATGIVDVYYASPAGVAASEDVTAANDNIEAHAFAVPDAITFTGASATATLINATGTAKIKNRAGLPTNEEIRQIIANAVKDAFKTFPIGGVDQDVDGNGVIYKVDLQAIAAAAFPGLYNVVITSPIGASTAIAAGHVATENQEADDWVLTIV